MYISRAARFAAAWLAASVICVSQPSLAAADFGSPPSGEIPILYNDHTVYATPDLLKQGRVLAAFVKDGVIYVPLRSMFEQMGATVTASNGGKTFTAVKSTTTVSVSLGSSAVVINGETRPLDVPPMVYKGVVLVPVRVISEALGAYVQWVPEKRLVVVRYIPATPPPVVPTAAPTAVPTLAATPTPEPTATPYTAFAQAAIVYCKNYNEFAAGGCCPRSWMGAAAYVFNGTPFAIKADYRDDAYLTSDNLTDTFGNHFTRFSTIDGGVSVVPVFLAHQTSFDARLLYQIAAPQIYIGLSYLQTTTNYGYPKLTGFGVGAEKLPSLREGLSWFGSAYYFPTASGTYTINNPASPNNGKSYRQQYQITKFDIGAALAFKHFPLYIYGGFAGEHYGAKQNAPIGQTHDGPYVGLGAKF